MNGIEFGKAQMIYDVLVIGGGPAGCKAAELAGNAGMKVVLFEKEQLGGVCLNYGCIPTKSLLHGIKLYSQMKNDAPLFGVTASEIVVDHNALWKRAEQTKNRLRSALRYRLENSRVNIIDGEALWQCKNSGIFEVSCGGQIFCGQHLILATGGQPRIPDIAGIRQGLQSGFVATPRDILKTPDIPQSLVILGGGAIGMEFATIYSGLGSRVTVIEKESSIGGGVDERISSFLLEFYRKRGVTFELSTVATCVAKNGLFLQNGKHLNTDKILLACGWESALKQYCLTNLHVIGDANGKAFSAPAAELEAECTVRKILGQPDKRSYYDFPHVIFTTPEVACWGQTLQQAKVVDPQATEVITPLCVSSRYAIEHPTENVFCIKVFSGEGFLIGFHIVGTGAAEVLSCVTKMPVHPSLSELITSNLYKL